MCVFCHPVPAAVLGRVAGSVLPGQPMPQSHLPTGSGPPHGGPGHRGASKEKHLDLGLCLNCDNEAPHGCRSSRQHRLTGGTAGDIETLWVSVSY